MKTWMKFGLGVFCVLCLIGIGVYFSPAGIIPVSHGYVYGNISKISYKGLVFKTYEGEMLLGYESSIGKTGVWTNPWRFSVLNSEIGQSLEEVSGEYVILRYTRYIWHNPLKADTHNLISQISFPISSQISSSSSPKQAFSKGIRTGRFVAVWEEGWIRKTTECILQQGSSGNNFFRMSVEDQYDLVEHAIKTGNIWKIQYEQHIFPWWWTRRTQYVVQSVTQL